MICAPDREGKSIVNYDDDDTYMKDSARSIGYEFHIRPNHHRPFSLATLVGDHRLGTCLVCNIKLLRTCQFSELLRWPREPVCGE